MPAGMTPDVIAAEVIKAHIDKDPKGKLPRIDKTYVEREHQRRAERAAREPGA